MMAPVLNYVRTHLVDFNVWGIQADVNTLYAVVDNSNELAVFEFLYQAGEELLHRIKESG